MRTLEFSRSHALESSASRNNSIPDQCSNSLVRYQWPHSAYKESVHPHMDLNPDVSRHTTLQEQVLTLVLVLHVTMLTISFPAGFEKAIPSVTIW